MAQPRRPALKQEIGSRRRPGAIRQPLGRWKDGSRPAAGSSLRSLLAVAGTVARGSGAAGCLAGGAVRRSVGGGGRGAGDVVPLEFLELGRHRVARRDELRVAIVGQGGQQKERREAVGRFLLLLVVLGG